MRQEWSDDEIEYIEENAGNLTDKEIWKSLNDMFGTRRGFQAVRKMRQRLGIQKANGRSRCEIVAKVEPTRFNQKK